MRLLVIVLVILQIAVLVVSIATLVQQRRVLSEFGILSGKITMVETLIRVELVPPKEASPTTDSRKCPQQPQP